MRGGGLITALCEIGGIGSLYIAIPCTIVWAMAKLSNRNEDRGGEIADGDWPHLPLEIINQGD